MTAILAAQLLSAGPFSAGNRSSGSILELLQAMASGNDAMSSPSAGGTLAINGQSLGSYDYVIKEGDQTVSSFSAADWFTNTADSRAAFVVVKGNLTINAGQVFTPSVRKLFTAIYVSGALTINGEISMTARGANHSSATGSNISAAAIRIATGTFSSVTNPQVPAAGALGGAGVNANSTGNQGADSDGAGSTGGGASGAASSSGGPSGSGSAGTAFTGGTGGGALRTGSGSSAFDGGIDGGKGGDASAAGTSSKTGGTGNPGGAGQDGGPNGNDGTGGVLFIVCVGQYSGSGSVTAQGVAGASGAGNPGGASGGGSITVLYGSDAPGPTPNANGGAAGTGSQINGSRGGNGTARKLAL